MAHAPTPRRGDPDPPDQVGTRDLETSIAEVEDSWDEFGAAIDYEQGDGP